VAKVSDAPAELEHLVAAVRGEKFSRPNRLGRRSARTGASTPSARRTRVLSSAAAAPMIRRAQSVSWWVRSASTPFAVNALCLLPDGRLASGSWDKTIRLWDPQRGAETARLEVDAPITGCAALADGGLVAGDVTGRLHWLEILN